MKQEPVAKNGKPAFNRNFITVTACVVIMVSIIVILLPSLDSTSEDQFTFCSSPGGGELTVGQYLGKSPDVVVPCTASSHASTSGWLGGKFARLTGIWSVPHRYPVTALSQNSFNGCGVVESIRIPDSVRDIHDWAFHDCPALKLIELPNTIDLIDRGTFFGCISLKSIVIPKSVAEIGPEAFKRCRELETVILENPEIRIAPSAFDECPKVRLIRKEKE